MERNVRIEVAIEKAFKNIGLAQQMIYSDPKTAVALLNGADEVIHTAHDELCLANDIKN